MVSHMRLDLQSDLSLWQRKDFFAFGQVKRSFEKKILFCVLFCFCQSNKSFCRSAYETLEPRIAHCIEGRFVRRPRSAIKPNA